MVKKIPGESFLADAKLPSRGFQRGESLDAQPNAGQVAEGAIDIEYSPEFRQITVQDRNGTVAVIELDAELLINKVLRTS